MKRRYKARPNRAASAPPADAAPGKPPWAVARPPALLALVIIFGAMGVGLAMWWNQPEYRPQAIGNPLVQPPQQPPQVVSQQPTIKLPEQRASIGTEELRGELLQMGEDLIAKFPESPEALHVAAMLYADLQKTPEAERLWRKCIQLAPHQAGPYVGVATAAMELGRDEEAVETLQKARAAGCSTPEIYHEEAAALDKLGRLEEAIQIAQVGLKAFPHSAENRLQLGQLQIQMGEHAQAEATLRQVMTDGLISAPLVFALATACERQDKTEEAAKFRQQFSDLKAQQAAAAGGFQETYDRQLLRIATASLAQAAAVYQRQQLPDEAERLLLRAVALDPENPAVASDLVSFCRRQGRIADARLVQRRLVDLEPRDAMHHINLASLSAQLGDQELAESLLKEAIRLRPDLSTGYASLAQLYLQMGRAEQARWYAEAAQRLEPNQP